MLKSRTLLLDTALNDIAALQTMYNVNMDLKKSPGAIPRVFFICLLQLQFTRSIYP